MLSARQDGLSVEYTPEFQRNIRDLSKKYPGIRQDIEPVISQIQMGQTPGDRVPGIGYPLFKVRIRNTDARKGKSGGYRVIYFLKTPDQIILITIYSKSDQSDVSTLQIKRIIESF